MKVLQYPLTQITFFFVFGILFNRYLNLEFKTGLIALVVVFLVFLMNYFASFRSKSLFLIRLFTILSFLLAFTVGNFTAIFHQETNDKNHYIHTNISTDESAKFKVVVLEKWKSTEKNNRFLAEILSLNDKTSKGKILVNLRKENSNTEIMVGSKLAIYSKLYPLQKPFNPDQFDYASFLKNKSIYAQTYVDSSSILVFNAKDKNLYFYSAVFRNRVISNLEKSNFNKKELAVVNALILGQRQDLDPKVLRDYQYAGAIHILSVSGLHVGFVLLFLNFFLNFLPNTNRYRLLKVITIVLVLWCFALVAGFSPSVVRSVTMFSFIAVGMHMKRKTYTFYTFYCSIFIILLFKPSFLFEVGFQLSYLAVFFILWLQPVFENWWQPKNKVSKHLWQVFTITLAAQLGTTPLSIYYFHQFSGLFFVTNLLIMFLLSIIMGVGLFTIIIAFWTPVPELMAKVLEKLIWLMNFIIEKIASIETFIFKDIPFNFWMLVTLYLTIFGIGYICIKRNFNTMAFLLTSVLLFQMSCFYFDFSANNKKDWMVFQAKNSSLILEREGKKVNVFTNKKDSLEVFDDRNIQSYNLANGTNLDEVHSIANFMFYEGKRIVVLDSNSVFVPHLKPDVVLITQSPKLNFERVLMDYNPKIVVVDASNYRNVVDRIRLTCLQKNIPFHAIAEKGYYKIE